MRSVRDVAIAIVFLGLAICSATSWAEPTSRSRARGLLLGALVGDAAGCGTEFRAPRRSPYTRPRHRVNDQSLKALSALFSIAPCDREASPYGPWVSHGRAGTLTDDSRHKIALTRAIKRGQGVLRVEELALVYRDWQQLSETTNERQTLAADGFREYAFAARWALGDRGSEALPPDRLWGGLPTSAGQMIFLPLALRYPGNPSAAYLETWELNFFETGKARDTTSALVAGLAGLLGPSSSGRTWNDFIHFSKSTDPFRFGAVPWVSRDLTFWIDQGSRAARGADREPHRLFEDVRARMKSVTGWESWVAITLAHAVMSWADAYPRAALELVHEFGEDTDSNLQLLGAILGALHGEELFSDQERRAVNEGLLEYGLTLEEFYRAWGAGEPIG